MKLRELLSGVEVLSMRADPDKELAGIYDDSRKVLPGGLFIAVPGFATDGFSYVGDAVKAGAAVVVAEKPCDGVGHVVVENARRTRSRIAANFYGRPTERMTVIGVTGTNGKTTTTYLIKDIIEHSLGEPCGLIGTLEIIIGDEVMEAERTTPDSIEIQGLFRKMLDAGIKYAVMEVSSHALKLDRVRDVKFHTGVFTNITQDHLDFHDSMEDYLNSKTLLFKMCRRGVLNLDDGAARHIIENADCEIITYSASDMSADLVAKNIRYFPNKVDFEALGIREIERAELKIPGKFSVYNALAAICAAMSTGIPLKTATASLRYCRGVKGRAEVVPTGRDFTVIIDYAHTPNALENILLTLRGFVKGRIVTVFGCGGDRDRTKRPIMGKIAESLSDLCIVTSDNPRTEDPEAIIADIVAGMSKKDKRVVIPNRVEAIGYAIKNAKPDDMILLAGKGHETYQEINGVKHHMDEREIVRGFLTAED
jgi:UDP-N-acetylmuramoyl-L-alanyl-D-glutamate--2,6-diaminopimelate ligase